MYLQFKRAAHIQNALTRAVCQAPWSASATELHHQLQWLLIGRKISYKTAVITHKARSTGTPVYLASLLNSYTAARTLHSSDKNVLSVPHTSLALSSKEFSVSATTTWNSFSDNWKDVEPLSTSKHRLKTKLFNTAYQKCNA